MNFPTDLIEGQPQGALVDFLAVHLKICDFVRVSDHRGMQILFKNREGEIALTEGDGSGYGLGALNMHPCFDLRGYWKYVRALNHYCSIMVLDSTGQESWDFVAGTGLYFGGQSFVHRNDIVGNFDIDLTTLGCVEEDVHHVHDALYNNEIPVWKLHPATERVCVIPKAWLTNVPGRFVHQLWQSSANFPDQKFAIQIGPNEALLLQDMLEHVVWNEDDKWIFHGKLGDHTDTKEEEEEEDQGWKLERFKTLMIWMVLFLGAWLFLRRL
jgi:hypothetical protein